MPMNQTDHWIHIWAIIVISISFILGVICLMNSYYFWSKRQYRFIEIRKPRLILLYCMCGAIPSLMVISPCKAYLDIFYASEHNQVQFYVNGTYQFIWWLLTFLQEFFISSMSIVIALRCWLLYYDHSYEISVVDKNWRGAIDPNATDFWLKNRKTWGDTGFLAGFGFLLINFVLIVFSIISIYSLQSGNLTSLNAVSLFLIAIPCYIFIAGLIFYGKRKKLFITATDKFCIIKELQYLSLSTLLMIIVYIIQLCDIKQLALLIECGQILFAFITSHIQNRWVIRQFKRHKRDMFLTEIGENIQHHSKTQSGKRMHGKTELGMIDVLRNKYGFAMFMRFCQSELNVEGLLFIVEVAQFKAKLVGEDEQIQSIMSKSETPSTEITTSTSSPSKESSTDDPYKKWERQNAAKKAAAKNKVILPSLSRVRKEEVKKQAFERFQGNVLSREWMPIANQLFVPKNSKKSKKSHKKKDGIASPEDINKLEVTKTDIKEMVIDLNAEYDENGDLIQGPKSEEEEDEIDINWIYDYAQYLFLKYIDVESEFSINVSYLAKQDLLLFFSKKMEKGFEFILNKHGISTTVLNQTENNEKESDYLMKIKEFLVHVFDSAVTEVWNLLARDTFLRFMHTEQYKYLSDKYKKQQLQLV